MTEPGGVPDLSVSLDPNDETGSVTVSWTAPDSGGSDITQYNLTYQIIGIGDCDFTFTVSICSNCN